LKKVYIVDVIDALNSRVTIRAFKPDPVSKEMILQILEAATRAPSTGNTQPWELFVAGGEALDRIRLAYTVNFQHGIPSNSDLPAPQTWPPALQKRMDESRAGRFKSMGIEPDDKARRTIFELAHQFFGAPTVVYLCMDRTLTPWSIFDIGMLAQSIMLAAQHYDVDSAPAFLFISYPGIIRAELEIPKNLSIIMGVALGYRDPRHPQNQYRSSRRPIREVVHFKDVI
jgi:nitroreductase